VDVCVTKAVGENRKHLSFILISHHAWTVPPEPDLPCWLLEIYKMIPGYNGVLPSDQPHLGVVGVNNELYDGIPIKSESSSPFDFNVSPEELLKRLSGSLTPSIELRRYLWRESKVL
jgi:hypothetical protein